MPEVVCPGCHKKIHPPERLAGRRVTCPRCEAVLMVPLLSDSSDSSEEIPTKLPAPEPEPESPPLPSSARFGIVALMLACVSLLILCLPFIGYASLVLSGIGVPVAILGWFRAHAEGNGMITRSPGGGGGIVGSFGTRASDYPLAGMAACLLALALALLPILTR